MKAVCFDMDGVLVDSEDYWVELEREELLPQVVPDEPVDPAETTGMNYRDIYDYLDREYETAWTKQAFVDWYDAAAETIYGEQVAILPGAAALVADLRNAGVAVALVSSSPVDWIETVTERFDLEFDAIVSGDAFDGEGKPHPAIFEHAADRLGVDPSETVAVEDSGHGVESASRAGMTVVGFRHGHEPASDLDGADVVAHSPADLEAYLRDRLA
ncbi:HAD family hydrolase [Halobacteriales archaeon Cl-PHB]